VTWDPNKTCASTLGTSMTTKIKQFGGEMQKLCPPSTQEGGSFAIKNVKQTLVMVGIANGK